MVLELPEHAFWKDALKADDLTSIFSAEIDGEIGISVVNPLDQFARKKGLKMALEGLKPVVMKVEQIRIEGDGDITLRLLVAGHPLFVTMGRSNQRAIVITDCRYDILNMYRTIYGRNTACTTQP